MATKSPAQRSLALLRSEGWTCAVCEHWNAYAGRRVDLFGVLDLVAIHPGHQGVLGIQTTSATNVSSRLHKIRESAEARVWLLAHNRIEVHGWRRSKGKWVCRRVEVTIADLAAEPAGEALS